MRIKKSIFAVALLVMSLQIPPVWAQTEVVSFAWCPPETGSLVETYELVACTDLDDVLGTALASAAGINPVPAFSVPEHPDLIFEGAASLELPTRVPYFVVVRGTDARDRPGVWSPAYDYDPGPPGGCRCGPVRL